MYLLYSDLCCSKSRRVAAVCGPSRAKLGTHPLNTQRMPSELVNCFAIPSIEVLPPWLMVLVLITSIGLQMVVAIKPARRDAKSCVGTLSFNPALVIKTCLIPS